MNAYNIYLTIDLLPLFFFANGERRSERLISKIYIKSNDVYWVELKFLNMNIIKYYLTMSNAQCPTMDMILVDFNNTGTLVTLVY